MTAPAASPRRTAFAVDHMSIEVARTGDGGATYALIAAQALRPEHRKPLFTGTLAPAMPAQLRALADHLDAVLAEGGGDA